jgi:hypothetical protein
MQNTLPGYLVPKLVMEQAGALSKQLINLPIQTITSKDH